jgi:hypothetical protein
LAKLAILVIGAAAAKIAKSMSFEGGTTLFQGSKCGDFANYRHCKRIFLPLHILMPFQHTKSQFIS